MSTPSPRSGPPRWIPTGSAPSWSRDRASPPPSWCTSSSRARTVPGRWSRWPRAPRPRSPWAARSVPGGRWPTVSPAKRSSWPAVPRSSGQRDWLPRGRGVSTSCSSAMARHSKSISIRKPSRLRPAAMSPRAPSCPMPRGGCRRVSPGFPRGTSTSTADQFRRAAEVDVSQSAPTASSNAPARDLGDQHATVADTYRHRRHLAHRGISSRSCEGPHLDRHYCRRHLAHHVAGHPHPNALAVERGTRISTCCAGGAVQGLGSADEPPAQHVDACLDLRTAGLCHRRASAVLAQLGVDDRMGFVAPPRPRGDKSRQLLAQSGAATMLRHRPLPVVCVGAGRLAALPLHLVRLTSPQELPDLLGFEQARQAEVLLLIR